MDFDEKALSVAKKNETTVVHEWLPRAINDFACRPPDVVPDNSIGRNPWCMQVMIVCLAMSIILMTQWLTYSPIMMLFILRCRENSERICDRTTISLIHCAASHT